MKKFFGFLLCVLALVLVIWLDLIIFFIGGINQVIDGFDANPNSVHDIVWGFIKVLLFTGFGSVAGFFIGMGGLVLLFSGSRKAKASEFRPRSMKIFPRP